MDPDTPHLLHCSVFLPFCMRLVLWPPLGEPKRYYTVVLLWSLLNVLLIVGIGWLFARRKIMIKL